MAGHNKWSKVKRHPGAFDAKRGKLYGKLAWEISFAATAGSNSPDLAACLRAEQDASRAGQVSRAEHLGLYCALARQDFARGCKKAGATAHSVRFPVASEVQEFAMNEMAAARFLRSSSAASGCYEAQRAPVFARTAGKNPARVSG